MGIDDAVCLDPLRFQLKDVGIRLREDHPPTERNPLPIKEYQTPAGTMSNTVRWTSGWPHGYDVPLLDDYGVSPGRSAKGWMEGRKSLRGLFYLSGKPWTVTCENVPASPEYPRDQFLLLP
jgi:hypothetical protein